MKYFGQSSVLSTQKDTCMSFTPGIFSMSFLTLFKCSKSMATPMANKSWSPTVFVATIMFGIWISLSKMNEESGGVDSVAKMCTGDVSIMNTAMA